MKKTIFFLFSCVTLSMSQSDSLFIQMYNGSVQSYAVLGIREISLSGPVTGVEDQSKAMNILSSFTLHQNFPNPFNPSTTIEYSIPSKGVVTIHIYDIQGRVVRRLEQTRKDAGEYAVQWNGRNESGLPVASGIYFCRVDFNGAALVKKLALIK